MKYPKKLFYYRQKAKLTQQEVVDHIGDESTSRLSKWEQGKALPSLPNLFKLAMLFHVSIGNYIRVRPRDG